MEEVFANQLASMVKGLPFGDLFQEASASSAPVSLMHQENSHRALKVGCTMLALEGMASMASTLLSRRFLAALHARNPAAAALM